MKFKIIAEKLSRGRILKRRLPDNVGGGPILVTPEAGLRFWFKRVEQCDPDLFRVAIEFVKKGAVVWDVGANNGLFTFASAGLAGSTGKVVAIEADTFMVSLLRQSARLRWPDRANVEVLPVAISNMEGISQFHISSRARASNSLAGHGSSQMGGVREQQSVITVTIDWLLDWRPAPHVLKIDVEGAEALVLEGGTRLLSEVRPVILCEVFSTSVEKVTGILKAHDYSLYDMNVARANRQPLEQATWNTIAYPAELVSKFVFGG